MSISLSYDVAAFNIVQSIQFNSDAKKTEGRLGAWRFTSSLFYVSSTDWKIKKIFFDFLVFIGVVIDQKDSKFQSIYNSSTAQFNKLEQEYNKEHISKQNSEKEDFQKQIQALTKSVENLKKNLSALENEKKDSSKPNPTWRLKKVNF